MTISAQFIIQENLLKTIQQGSSLMGMHGDYNYNSFVRECQ